MRKTPIKLLSVGVVALGLAVAGAALLRGQGHQGPPSGDPDADLTAVRADLQTIFKSGAECRRLFNQAKKQKDIIRTSCIQEKLLRLNNIMGLAREQVSKYLMDKAAGNPGSSMSLRERVSMFKERADDMLQEARQCAGEAIKVTDKPEVVEMVDPKIPQNDPTDPIGSIWVMPRPPEGSPYF